MGTCLLLGGAVGWIAIGGVPGNDDFSLRTKLGDADDLRASGSNFASSREPGEPLHAGEPVQSGSVWWSWRAPADARDVLIEVEMAGGRPLLGVYQGFAVDHLEVVAQSANGTLSFPPIPGEEYHLAVAGAGSDVEGAIHLRIQSYSEDDSRPPEPPEPEMALLLPEVRIEQEEEQQQTLNYVRTTQNDRELVSPLDPAFESDRNTSAASELPPEEGGLENLPSQDGVELPFLEMADRDVAEGKLADDATIPVAAIEIVEPLLAATESIESLELEPAPEAVDSPEPATEAAEAAQPDPAAVAESLLDDSPIADSGEMAAEFVGERPVDGDGEQVVEDVPEADPSEPRQQEVAAARPPEKRETLPPDQPNPYPVPEIGAEEGPGEGSLPAPHAAQQGCRNHQQPRQCRRRCRRDPTRALHPPGDRRRREELALRAPPQVGFRLIRKPQSQLCRCDFREAGQLEHHRGRCEPDHDRFHTRRDPLRGDPPDAEGGKGTPRWGAARDHL